MLALHMYIHTYCTVMAVSILHWCTWCNGINKRSKKITLYIHTCMILAWADQSWNARSKCAYERLWSMAYRTWQIEHRGEFWLALRRATSLPRGNKLDYVSYKTLVRWRFACALRGSARGFWFIDPLGLRMQCWPTSSRGLCTVATRACHVNHTPPSYNYNIAENFRR